MAKAALKNAKDPDVRKMAERTIKEQGKEIEEMSRMAEKHREHAVELGVSHYLGKPYAEEELLGLVRRYAEVQTVP